MKTNWKVFLSQTKQLDSVATSMKLVNDLSRDLNYAALARRIGLQSRSYARMIFHGKRSASLETLTLILEALKAPSVIRRFFIAMWEIENTVEGTALYKRRQKVLDNIRQKLHHVSDISLTEEAFVSPELPKVFAALGTIDRGASVEQIQRRTRLSNFRIQAALTKFIELGIAIQKKDRYFPASSEMILEQSSPDSFFQQLYLTSIRDGMNRAKQDFANHENLFAAFSVSVNSCKLKEHADQLYQRLKDYLNEIEDPEGDTVISLNTGFYR